MPCERIGNAVICYNNIYQYKGFVFEHHDYLGPVYLKKDLTPSQRTPVLFWDAYAEFYEMSDEEKEKHLFDPT